MPAKLRKIWQTAAIAHCKNAARPTPTPQAARRPRGGRQPAPPAMAGGMCRLWPHRCHPGVPGRNPPCPLAAPGMTPHRPTPPTHWHSMRYNTGRFELRNSPYYIAERPVLQRRTACIATPNGRYCNAPCKDRPTTWCRRGCGLPPGHAPAGLGRVHATMFRPHAKSPWRPCIRAANVR